MHYIHLYSVDLFRAEDFILAADVVYFEEQDPLVDALKVPVESWTGWSEAMGPFSTNRLIPVRFTNLEPLYGPTIKSWRLVAASFILRKLVARCC